MLPFENIDVVDDSLDGVEERLSETDAISGDLLLRVDDLLFTRGGLLESLPDLERDVERDLERDLEPDLE